MENIERMIDDFRMRLNLIETQIEELSILYSHIASNDINDNRLVKLDGELNYLEIQQTNLVNRIIDKKQQLRQLMN